MTIDDDKIALIKETISLRDSLLDKDISRIASSVENIEKRLEKGDGRFSNLERRQDETERRLVIIEARRKWYHNFLDKSFMLFIGSVIALIVSKFSDILSWIKIK